MNEAPAGGEEVRSSLDPPPAGPGVIVGGRVVRVKRRIEETIVIDAERIAELERERWRADCAVAACDQAREQRDRLSADLDAAHARIAELESRNGYEVAAEWRDRFKAAEAENADLRTLLRALADRVLAAHEVLAHLAERRAHRRGESAQTDDESDEWRPEPEYGGEG